MSLECFSTHCDKRHLQSGWFCYFTFILKHILNLLGLCEHWIQMVPYIIRCHGSMYIQFVECGFDPSKQCTIEKAGCGLMYVGSGRRQKTD